MEQRKYKMLTLTMRYSYRLSRGQRDFLEALALFHASRKPGSRDSLHLVILRTVSEGMTIGAAAASPALVRENIKKGDK